ADDADGQQDEHEAGELRRRDRAQPQPEPPPGAGAVIRGSLQLLRRAIAGLRVEADRHFVGIAYASATVGAAQIPRAPAMLRSMTDGGPAALRSWRATATRDAIVDFVERVTRSGGPDYVPPARRVAVFDNDGTRWCERPLPIQADFLLRRVAEMA